MAINYLIGDLRLVTYFFALLIIILFSSRSSEFIKFWGPFLVFWIFYDSQHIFTKSFLQTILVKEVYDLEILLTGWFTGGRILAFIFQDYIAAHSGDTLVIILDSLSAIVYLTHLLGPVILGTIIYRRYRDTIEVKRFVFTFIGVSFAALITFQLIPAAPPWYIYNDGNGLNFTVPLISGAIKNPAGLKSVDELLGFPFFTVAYESLNANPFAPIPSVHNAYAIIMTIYSIRIIGKKANWMVIYPPSMAFASIWLNHHYIIDIYASIIYIIIFYYLAKILFKTKEEDLVSVSPSKESIKVDTDIEDLILSDSL